MARVIVQDFYYKGAHYDEVKFDLDVANKNDTEISVALAKKLDEYETLEKSKTT